MIDSKLGIGGAPTRATTLPDDAAKRKQHPIASGVLDYFPDALVAVSQVSWKGNEQHNPGEPLHWNRSKSSDEADTMLRHFLQRGSLDGDGLRHSAKMAWRALALLQKEIEADKPPLVFAEKNPSASDSKPANKGRTVSSGLLRYIDKPPLVRLQELAHGVCVPEKRLATGPRRKFLLGSVVCRIRKQPPTSNKSVELNERSRGVGRRKTDQK